MLILTCFKTVDKCYDVKFLQTHNHNHSFQQKSFPGGKNKRWFGAVQCRLPKVYESRSCSPKGLGNKKLW